MRRRLDISEGERGYEACDDGNRVDTDGCRNNCTSGVVPVVFEEAFTRSANSPHCGAWNNFRGRITANRVYTRITISGSRQGTGIELSANSNICSCTSGYVARPCIGNANWGGVNGTTCSAVSQTIRVTCPIRK